MIRCEACGLHQANPACRACLLVELASGQPFFQSMRHQRLTQEYRVALRRLGDEEAVHKEVKAVAKTLFVGSAGA